MSIESIATPPEQQSMKQDIGDMEQLDDVVLINCASRLPFSERFRFTPIAKRFAFVLRASCFDQRLLLWLHCLRLPYVDEDDSVTTPYYVIQHRIAGVTSQRQIKILHHCGDLVRIAIKMIFANFKRIHCLTLRKDLRLTQVLKAEELKFFAECILNALSCERSRSVQFTRLEVSLGWNIDTECRLIEELSPLLERLSFDTTSANEQYDKLWFAVNKCTNLEKLRFAPAVTTGSTKDTKLQNCLKTLKIAELETGGNANLKYFFDTLHECKYLQKLLIFDKLSDRNTFASSNALSLISKLRTIGFAYNAIELENEKELIVKVLHHLPRNGYMYVKIAAVDFIVPGHRCLRSSEGSRNELADIKAATEVSKVLKFWLTMSEWTEKTIKLRFNPNVEDAVLSIAYQQLIADEIFHDLLVENRGHRSILSHKHAKIVHERKYKPIDLHWFDPTGRTQNYFLRRYYT